MKIHYFSGEPWEEAFVNAKITGQEIIFHKGSIATEPNLTDADAEVLCVFVDSKISGAELDRFPGVKLIATRSTGFDHIDLAAAKTRGVTVVTVPFYGENTVAEFAFALILSLSRRIPEAQTLVKSGSFSPASLRGFDLAGKTLGVVGCGHIGMHVIRMANGFGMKIIAFDMHPDAETAEKYNVTFVPLADLFATADIISLHVPYNEHTHHLINKENIRSIKKGAYLINTARGAVVDTEALIAALQDGTLAGAGLDVLEEEGDMIDEIELLSNPHPNEDALKIMLENHYLIEHPRVIVTPHLAFNTIEAIERIVDTTVENIKHFAEGTPTNVVS
jgi:D-lactate dehydrogenase